MKNVSSEHAEENALQRDGRKGARAALGQSPKKAFCFALTAFCVTAAGSLIAAAVNGVFPFGKETLMYSDLVVEYLPFLTEFFDKIKEGGSLLWSWRLGIGGPFFGTYMYYLASPLNLLILLFDRAAIQNVIAALILLRQAIASFNMTLFLSLRRRGGVGLYAAVCGVLYAFCGWFCSFYFNCIWLDTFMLLPLLALGIERLIEQKKPWLYAAVLCFTIISNFYMAFIACVFAVLYFLYACFTREPAGAPVRKTEKGKRRRPASGIDWRDFAAAAGSFIGASVFSAALLGVVLVPLLLSLRHGAANEDVVPVTSFFSNLTQQVAAMFSGSRTTAGAYANYANAYFGMLPLAALPLMFSLKSVTPRQKTAACLILGFYALSFNVKFLDFLWHGLRYPSGFVFRQSFQFSFFALLFTHGILLRLQEIPKKAFFISGGSFAFLLFLALHNIKEENAVLSGGRLAVSLFFFILCSGILFLLRGEQKKRAAAAALGIVLLCTSAADGVYMLSNNVRRLENMDYETLQGLYTDKLALDEQMDDDDGFYRRDVSRMLINYGSYLHINGLHLSSSTANAELLTMMNRLGVDSNRANVLSVSPQTPVFYSLFGCRYLIERTVWSQVVPVATLADRADEGFSPAGEAGGLRQYRYAYALPPGFVAEEALAEWTPADYAAVENQNAFFRLAAGAKDILLPCEGQRQDFSEEIITVAPAGADRVTYSTEDSMYPDAAQITYTFTAQRDGAIYIYLDMRSETRRNYFSVEVFRPDGNSERFDRPLNTLTTAVWDMKAGEEITVTFYPRDSVSGSLTAKAFQVDTEELRRAYQTVCENGLYDPEVFSDDFISGSVSVNKENALLCTSVPYDRGWSVTVDGRELPADQIIKIGGALIGLRLEKGAHTVSFSYHLPGLTAGGAVSVMAAAVGILWLAVQKVTVQPYNK